jgi:Uma2 family endonuclease
MLTTAISLKLEPGQKFTLQPVSWKRFEAILEELGEKRSSRVAYANEILEIMAPFPEHERNKVLLADFVKAILKIQKRDW